MKTAEKVFDAVDVDHSPPPWLHLQLGIVNNLLANVIEEVQAAAEAWTPEYVNSEEHCVWLDNDISLLKKAKEEFVRNNKQRKKVLNTKTKDQSINNEEKAELSFMGTYEGYLDYHKKTSSGKLITANKTFEQMTDSKKNPNNSKAYGQPVWAIMDEKLKLIGVDRAAYFGETIQGGGCIKVLDKGTQLLGHWNDAMQS